MNYIKTGISGGPMSEEDDAVFTSSNYPSPQSGTLLEAIANRIKNRPGVAGSLKQPETRDEWLKTTIEPPALAQRSPALDILLPILSAVEIIGSKGQSRTSNQPMELLDRLRGAGQREYMDALRLQEEIRQTRDKEAYKGAMRRALGLPTDSLPEGYQAPEGMSAADLIYAFENPKEYYEYGVKKKAEEEKLQRQQAEDLAKQQRQTDKEQSQMAFQVTSAVRQDPRIRGSQEIVRNAQAMSTIWNDTVKRASPESKAAIDQSLITLFNKVLDPGSVVRESEYARTPEGQAILDRIPGYIDKLRKGGAGITDPFRDEMVRIANELARAAQQTRSTVLYDYAQRSKAMGLPMEKVFGPTELMELSNTERLINKARKALSDPKATPADKAAAQRLLDMYGGQQ